MRLFRCVCTLILLCVASVDRSARASPKPVPKLVVLLAVDQMRADYVDWYGARWKGGLRRLFDKGAWFKNARYPYLNTVTCPGHATIGTGAYPRTHGMILNAWYDRERKRVIECTDDSGAPLLPYAGPLPKRGDSARNLMAPTLGDEMQAQLSPRARVMAFSMKARATINMAGHTPDAALWFEGSSWVTSSAFTATKTPWLVKLIADNPIAAIIEKPWVRLLSPSGYRFDDTVSSERPPTGWTVSFPHALAGEGAGMFASSSFADDYLGLFARAAVSEDKLGRGASTDLLAVSFSMTDFLGHWFGPRSHEVQDVLARLDVTLGLLLDALDRQIGANNYVVGLTADHGVALVPEQAQAEGKDAGRISISEVQKLANAAIVAELGKGQHVVSMQSNDLWLAPGVHDQLSAKPGAIGRVLTATRKAAGVADVFDRDEIADPSRASDTVRRAAALSHHAGRSGDMVISPKRDWIVGDLGSNHGSLNDYDQRVPLILFGAGIKPGRYEGPASPADLAPTLAHVIHVKMPKADGKPLTNALR